MRGHVHRRGAGWGYVVDVGRDPVTGKRRQRTKSGFETRCEAEAAVRVVLEEVRTGADVRPSTQTVGEYLAGWLERVKPGLRPTTWDGYRKDVAHVTSRLGAVPLQQLQAVQLEDCYAELAESGGVKGQGLSAKTIGNAHSVLGRALGDAERLGVVSRNVARLARPPKAEHVEIPPRSWAGSWRRSRRTGCTRRSWCWPRRGCDGPRCWGCGGRMWTCGRGTCR
jgi:hypothetical protein